MGSCQTALAQPDACLTFMFPVMRGRVQAGAEAPVLAGEISPAVPFMSLLQLEQNINLGDQRKLKGSLAVGKVTSRRRLCPAWLQFKPTVQLKFTIKELKPRQGALTSDTVKVPTCKLHLKQFPFLAV